MKLKIEGDHEKLEIDLYNNKLIDHKRVDISAYNWGHSGIITLNKEQFEQLYQFLTDNKDFFND